MLRLNHANGTVSTVSLPHRLQPGESFQVLYNSEQLVEESTKLGGETPVRLRPYGHDSLGNQHMPHHGFAYRKANGIASSDGPSPGRFSEEDFKQLKPAEQQRYSRHQSTKILPRR